MAIELISGIKPKNGGSFHLVEAEDVLMPDGRRLSEFSFSETDEGILMEEQTLDGFTFNEAYEYYSVVAIPAPFEMTVGKTYHVVWDGVDYEVKAQDTAGLTGVASVSMGDLSSFALEGNGEPFAIVYTAAGMPFFSLTDTEPASHTVMVYQSKGNDASGLPAVTTDDNGKILQVVDGSWKLVAIADSEVKTYIDSYINEALGGDY